MDDFLLGRTYQTVTVIIYISNITYNLEIFRHTFVFIWQLSLELFDI